MRLLVGRRSEPVFRIRIEARRTAVPATCAGGIGVRSLTCGAGAPAAFGGISDGARGQTSRSCVLRLTVGNCNGRWDRRRRLGADRSRDIGRMKGGGRINRRMRGIAVPIGRGMLNIEAWIVPKGDAMR